MKWKGKLCFLISCLIIKNRKEKRAENVALNKNLGILRLQADRAQFMDEAKKALKIDIDYF